jgi:hypothetical protein
MTPLGNSQELSVKLSQKIVSDRTAEVLSASVGLPGSMATIRDEGFSSESEGISDHIEDFDYIERSTPINVAPSTIAVKLAQSIHLASQRRALKQRL